MAVDTTSSLPDGWAPISERTGSGPATIVLVRAPRPSKYREQLHHLFEALGALVGSDGHPAYAQVLHDGHLSKQPSTLGHEGQAGSQHPVGAVTGHGLAVEAHLALSGAKQPGDAVEHGGLARAVGADEPDDFIGSDVEAHPA